MNGTNQVIKSNKREEKDMNERSKQEIYLNRCDAEIEEQYRANAKGPVYVQFLSDVCVIKGADMFRRGSHDYLFADQVIMEAEKKLQKQSMRISKHPIKIEGNIVVLDSLEIGNLCIFEPHFNPVYVKHSSEGCAIEGAELIGKIETNILPEERAVLITEIYCKDGYEELVEAMIDQVEFFADYYEDFDKVGMTDFVYKKWDFCKA